MRKRKMALADSDERYLKEISYYFMEKLPQFELLIFTRRETLYQYLESDKADILVVDEAFAEEQLIKLTPSTTRIVLSMGISPIDGFEMVRKYQRMDTLSEAVLLKYAEESNTLDTVKGNSATKITAFYSPAGGTGKTTLALAMATAGAQAGMSILYLNLEEIDSVKDIFGKTPGNLSDIFLVLKTRGVNVAVKMKGCVGKAPSAGFYYISGVDSISEYEEINKEDMKHLIIAVRELADYDLVIVDLGSGFTDKTKAILNEVETILFPAVLDEGSLSKLGRFVSESKLHDIYEPLLKKMKLIYNKVEAHSGEITALPDSISSRIPCCASIAKSSVLAKKRNILQAGDMIFEVMKPIFQTVMEERAK